MLLNMSLMRGAWCTLMQNEVTDPFSFEEPTVTGDTFLAMLYNTVLCHVPVGTVFQSNGARHHFHRVSDFLDRGVS